MSLVSVITHSSCQHPLQIGVLVVAVPHGQIPWWITSNDLPSPERLRFQYRSEVGQIHPQLSDSPCWAEHPPWIHDGLNNWSHCGRIHIYSAWVSGYALKSVWTQHTSITNALPQFWKRQSHHPSRLGNMLSSIHLGNSALTSERLQGHCTTQRACVHTWKILDSHCEGCILFQCLSMVICQKPAFRSRQEKYPAPTRLSMASCMLGQWIRIFFGPHIQLVEVYAKV